MIYFDWIINQLNDIIHFTYSKPLYLK